MRLIMQLLVAEMIVTRFGGTIWFDSVVKQYTEFAFSFKLDDASDEVSPAEQASLRPFKS